MDNLPINPYRGPAPPERRGQQVGANGRRRWARPRLRTLVVATAALAVIVCLNCRVTNDWRYSFAHGWQIVKDGNHVQGWPWSFRRWPMDARAGDWQEPSLRLDVPAALLNCLVAAVVCGAAALIEMWLTRGLSRLTRWRTGDDR
jgi:hypothetical protein